MDPLMSPTRKDETADFYITSTLKTVLQVQLETDYVIFNCLYVMDTLFNVERSDYVTRSSQDGSSF